MIDIYKIPNQLPGEEIKLVFRRYGLVLIFIIVKFFLMSLVPIVAIFLFYEGLASFTPSYVLLAMFISLFYLIIWIFFFQSFIDYYLDIWIITNERIIAIEQKDLFHRVISEYKLYRIQDVTSTVKGFLETIFNYGDVHIQTASETQRFIFKEVSDPARVVKLVLEQTHFNRIKHRGEPGISEI